MKNILNEADYSEMTNRIQELSETNARLWGDMDVQQMLFHCTTQLKIALGDISHKRQGPSYMRSKLGKWLLFSNIPWPKGAETPAKMNVKTASNSFSDIETGKKELLNYLERVRQQKNLNEHPFFGELNRKEWARLTYKHLDHHLKQFGSR